jgi:hypothetical protein
MVNANSAFSSDAGHPAPPLVRFVQGNKQRSGRGNGEHNHPKHCQVRKLTSAFARSISNHTNLRAAN